MSGLLELPDLEAVKSLVITISQQELLSRFGQVQEQRKADGSIVTAADLAMQQRLSQELQQRWPEIHFLAEEMNAQQQHELFARQHEALWCLDPLDGTSNFASGLPFFSVSLALIVDGQIELGVVYDPVRMECFAARRGLGATLDGQTLRCHSHVNNLAQTLANVDFKRLPKTLAQSLASEPPYRSQRSLGSVALDWCWLAANRFQLYLHGKQKLWDYAAGSLILHEAGGFSTTLKNQPVWPLQLSPVSVMAANDEKLFIQWRDLLLDRM